MRKLERETVIITGASSGVGRTASKSFARRGAYVVLAARRENLLGDVVRECEMLGGRAIAVPTDVTDAGAMRELANTAAKQLGPIRVWVNNAGVGAVASYVDTPIDAHRRVVETNLIGYMNSAQSKAVPPCALNQTPRKAALAAKRQKPRRARSQAGLVGVVMPFNGAGVLRRLNPRQLLPTGVRGYFLRCGDRRGSSRCLTILAIFQAAISSSPAISAQIIGILRSCQLAASSTALA
jgi:NAD(P)-dependent dehydrogenase (short-subunit alcohol dehydrogenase family)